MRVFVYCRVAHDDSFSLEAQAAQLRRYAEQAGYTIIGATAEQGSGLTLDRPGLEKVTQAVLDGKVDMLLVNSIDRIGREWGMTQAYQTQGKAPVHPGSAAIRQTRRNLFLNK